MITNIINKNVLYTLMRADGVEKLSSLSGTGVHRLDNYVVFERLDDGEKKTVFAGHIDGKAYGSNSQSVIRDINIALQVFGENGIKTIEVETKTSRSGRPVTVAKFGE